MVAGGSHDRAAERGTGNGRHGARHGDGARCRRSRSLTYGNGARVGTELHEVVASSATMTLPDAPLRGILETALYVDDLARARRFYQEVAGCVVMLDTPRLVAMSVAERSVLLLFKRGATEASVPTAGGIVPGHGGSGVQHVAFAIDETALDAWIERLGSAGVEIESRVRWQRGGQSVYVRDPDGHSVEFVTPGLWAIY
jgi:catechol 2,3-dioxygenase-like lactoylglutathione lyase family enzyme